MGCNFYACFWDRMEVIAKLLASISMITSSVGSKYFQMGAEVNASLSCGNTTTCKSPVRVLNESPDLSCM
jgi:hypothetical protein